MMISKQVAGKSYVNPEFNVNMGLLGGLKVLKISFRMDMRYDVFRSYILQEYPKPYGRWMYRIDKMWKLVMLTQILDLIKGGKVEFI